MKEDAKLRVQLVESFILVIFGLILLTIGILTPPQGEIHSSVLVAFGEVATFSGTLLGMNYSYKRKRLLDRREDERRREEDLQRIKDDLHESVDKGS